MAGLPTTTGRIRDELTALIDEGWDLRQRENLARLSDEDKAAVIARTPAKTRDSVAKDLAEAPTKVRYFGREYQSWYSAALRVIEHVLPDRYDEFRTLYKTDRRKQLDGETYGIADYIARLAGGNVRWESAPTIAMRKFDQQIDILRSALPRLDSLLGNITRELQALVLDDEVAAARTLLKAGHARAAGAIAGVVLESHLKQVAASHGVTIRKNAALATVNDALKDAHVYDVPQWRRIQHLTDVRNLCAHSGDRDPTKDEVADLIAEVDKVVHTLF